MNLCGACTPRRFVTGDRTRHAECAACGLHTDCVWVDPNPVPIAPRVAPREPWPARTRLVPSMRLRR